ncbi:MAG: hypothetical protein L0Y44_09815 [Phycisphaerales bacterium]|nr:hypothetical protein [Phycisphaerales bacterium]
MLGIQGHIAVLVLSTGVSFLSCHGGQPAQPSNESLGAIAQSPNGAPEGFGTYVSALAGTEVGCPGDSLLAQQPDLTAFSAYVSEIGATFLRFEDFHGVAGAIEGIQWYGLQMQFTGSGFVQCTETDFSFQVTLLEDNAGNPGSVVCDYFLTPTVVPIETKVKGVTLYQYTVTLPSPCIIVNGWLSIVGYGDPDCWFLWLSSLDGDDHSLCKNCQSYVQRANLNFCLLGKPGGIFGACCNQSTGSCADNVEINQCITPGLKFTPNTTCANLDPPCAIVTGACCLHQGECAVTTATDCADMNGTWLGPETLCVQCPPVGACCVGFSDCSIQTEADCSRTTLSWLGPDTTCEDCPQQPVCDKGALFGQNPDTPLSFQAGTSEEDSTLRRYEDFSGVAGPIQSLKWWGLDLHPLGGSLWTECTEKDPTFDISFHPNAGGVPGAAICSYTLPATRTPLGIAYLGAELNEYTVELPSPCIITNGWISIVGLGDPECWFLWMSAGTGSSHCDNCLPPQQGNDYAVCFNGEFGGVFGACCNDATGQCLENIEITNCLGASQRFAPNQPCSALNPPCGVILGACCFADATCTILTEADCAAAGGNWLAANSICASCPCLTPCPSGGDPEGEPVCNDSYVDTFNPGCFSKEPAFSPILPNQTICGTSGVYKFNGVELVGDFDWYEIILANTSQLFWSAEAEFRPQVWILDGNNGCPATGLAAAATLECESVSVNALVGPGRYWLLIGPFGATDSATCGARYTATLATLSTCPADIAPPPTGDGQVNVSDLLTLISYWGKCAEGEPCPADIAPFGGDGSVNVSDLLMVIELWGPCF